MYNYPLRLTYKFFTIGNKIKVTDTQDNPVFFVEMKNFKLKEDIRVYKSDRKEQELFIIKADRIIDFSAKYHFSKQGVETGAIKRKGMKSLWTAHYDIFNQTENATHAIEEDNPWVKLMDSLIGIIPFGSLFSGYFFHPRYNLYSINTDKTQPILSLSKQASFIEARFSIEKLREVENEELEERMLQSLITVVLLEKMRG